MKNKTLLNSRMVLLALVLGAGVARGTLYTETFGGAAIPQGSPVGVALSGSVSDIASGNTVGGLTVDLTVSGGYNGSLYAYLVAPNGTLVTLLNQPGVTSGNPFGYAGSGLNVTLSDTAAGSIQTATETAGAVFAGTYQAAGTLANINGSAADGTWTLFFADVASGGGQATLTGWNLDITAVPEPVNVALAFFGVGVLGIGAVRAFRFSRKQSLPPSQTVA